jgi:hypothetical protein
MEKHYWLHRASYEGGLVILEKEKKLTIGYSDAASNDEMNMALASKNYDSFCFNKAYGVFIYNFKAYNIINDINVRFCIYFINIF